MAPMATDRTRDQKLALFSERVTKALSRRAVVDKTLRAGFSLKASEDATSLTFNSGDEEELRALLIDFRPFTMEKEDVFYNRISNDLELRLADPELKEGARAA